MTVRIARAWVEPVLDCEGTWISAEDYQGDRWAIVIPKGVCIPAAASLVEVAQTVLDIPQCHHWCAPSPANAR